MSNRGTVQHKYQFKLAGRTWNCYLKFGQYSNGRTAIQIMDSEDHSHVATATVNIPDEAISNDEVIIKDYSENKGILEQFIEYGIVGNPIAYATSGYVNCPICKLLIQL